MVSPGMPEISVVVAAYNAEDTIARAVESVLLQSYPLEKIELIVVDDCSDDDTASIVRSFESVYPGTVIVLQTPSQSGSPAEPRNVGLTQARGQYVFFLDSDDWLGREAVERMLLHAREWRSDMLLVKIVGEGGREVPTSMFKRNQPNADVFRSRVLYTFGPYKLYKRSLVQGLRFPPFMPEDISFVLRAYVGANTVSVAADYDYYHLEYVGGGKPHASLSSWDDVDSNLDAYEDIFGFIGENIAKHDQNGVLLRRLFKRDVCNTLRTIALEPDVAKAQDQLLRLTRIVKPFYRPLHLARLPKEDRSLLWAAFGSRYF